MAETPDAAAIRAAFDTFGCDDVVLKRQVGAARAGSAKFAPGDTAGRRVLDRPGMIQPLSLVGEGEYSFLFVDGEFSHALVKRPADGDYRIQAAYGGQSQDRSPARRMQARAVLEALEAPPLYARVDMVRDEDGADADGAGGDRAEPVCGGRAGIGDMLAAALAKSSSEAVLPGTFSPPQDYL